jgi:hypothetical protein
VALAVLSLLSEAAGKRPLVCVIDDEQWLDQASAQALGIVARRLAADPVGLVFAARVPGSELTGLPELTVKGPGRTRRPVAMTRDVSPTSTVRACRSAFVGRQLS